MEAIIFIIYLLLFCFFVYTISFFNKSGLNRLTLISIFALKVSAGVAYGVFYKLPRYYAGADTWRFYRLSLDETKWLLLDPFGFVKDLFVYGYERPGNVFVSNNNYWNDLKSNVPVKLMAVMNVITYNSYYSNIILFNFLFLFGLVALFRVFNHFFPGKKKLLIAGLFLLPSTLFWCSGIHKDGLILSATGLIIYCFYFGLQSKFSLKYIACILLCLLLIFSLRNYLVFALLPALGCWWFCQKFKYKSWIVFGSIYMAGLILFFALPHLSSSLSLPQYVVQRQQEFRQLEGSSVVNMPELLPSFTSFISYLPYALDMALLRPHFSEIKNHSYLPAAAEILLLFFLMIVAAFFSIRIKKTSPFIFFLFFFSGSILLICGYTIPFSGAIVRYRSLVFPLIITPLLCTCKLIKNKNMN